MKNLFKSTVILGSVLILSYGIAIGLQGVIITVERGVITMSGTTAKLNITNTSNNSTTPIKFHADKAIVDKSIGVMLDKDTHDIVISNSLIQVKKEKYLGFDE